MTAAQQNGPAKAKSSYELAADARAELARLHHDLLDAEDRVVTTHAAQLLEANEQLVVSTLRIQTEAEQTEREIRESFRPSQLDELTELPNRTLLLDRFGQAIAHAKRNQTLLALLFLDLDKFKDINDTHGHTVGDQTLQHAARCITSVIRAEDTASRHGGDEFLILLTEISRANDAILVAEKVIASFATPTTLEGRTIHLSVCIGISVYPRDGEDPRTLIDRADAAMYIAKKDKLSRFAFHHEPGRAPSSKPPAQNRRSP